MAAKIDYDGGLTCALQCGNLERAIAWYRDVLGFGLAYKIDDMGWCEFHTSVAKVTIGLSQVEKPEVKGGATLVFGVRDIDVARATLEGQGVKFDGDTMTIPDMVRLATFYDPDGNKLMLYQSLSDMG